MFVFKWLANLLNSLNIYGPPEQIQMLAAKFGVNESALNILDSLQRIGVIAGSSVSSVLVPIDFSNKVHDIDVFVDTEEAFNQALKTLQHPCSIYHIFDRPLDENLLSVVAVTHPFFKIDIQVIMHCCETPIDVIKKFDLDYVQCAVHKGQLMVTPEFQEMSENPRASVLKFNKGQILKGYRLSKAIDKGFRAPLYGKYMPHSGINQIEITETEALQAKKTYLNVYCPEIRSHDMIDFQRLVVCGWNPTSKKSYPYPRWAVSTNGVFILKHLSDPSVSYKVPGICIPITITEYYPDNRRLRVEDNHWLSRLKLYNPNYLKLKRNADVDFHGPGKYHAVLQYYKYSDENYAMNICRVVQLLPSDLPIVPPTIKWDIQY